MMYKSKDMDKKVMELYLSWTKTLPDLKMGEQPDWSGSAKRKGYQDWSHVTEAATWTYPKQKQGSRSKTQNGSSLKLDTLKILVVQDSTNSQAQADLFTTWLLQAETAAPVAG